jgi:hypothetical protein
MKYKLLNKTKMENEPVKKTKGRPKKVLQETEPVQVEKKQRGRKKKIVTEPIEPTIIKKRGRKPVSQYYGSTTRSSEPNMSCIESFILKIEHDTIEDEIQVEPLQELSILSEYLDNNSKIDVIKDDNQEYESIRDLYEKKLDTRKNQDLLILNTSQETIANTEILIENNKKEEWIEKVESCCFWCCHVFNTPCLGLPLSYNKKNKKFAVKGIFCSFPCMMAYDKEYKFFENDLIYFMYKYMYGEINTQKIAPPRECLKMFGGTMDITEFRNISNTKSIKLLRYPMYPVREYTEEINIEKIKNDNSQIFNRKIKEKEPESSRLDFLRFS